MLILLFFFVFDEDDLICLVEIFDGGKFCVIVVCEYVLVIVVEVIIDKGEEKLVGIVVSNDGVEFSQDVYEKVFVSFCENQGVMEVFVV